MDEFEESENIENDSDIDSLLGTVEDDSILIGGTEEAMSGDDAGLGTETDDENEGDSNDDYEDNGAISDDLADDGASDNDDYDGEDNFDQDDIDEVMEENGDETDDEDSDEKAEKFVADEKISYEAANEKKPGKLNKKVILNTIVISLATIFLVSIFMPESCKQKKNKDAKKNGPAAEVMLNDFKSTATNSAKGSGRNARAKGKKVPYLADDGHWYDEEGNIVDEAVANGEYDDVLYGGQSDNVEDQTNNIKNQKDKKNEQEKKKQEQQQQQQQVQQTGGGGYVSERPDTRGDALQTGIYGIKGLSSSRTNYATDYEQTRIQNMAQASQNGMGTTASGLPDFQTVQNSILSTVNQQNGMTSYKLQNDQEGKQNFHTNGSENAGTGEWRPLNSLWEGTVFEAELTTAFNTDLPGEITARITRNVYSSQTGEYLLIPQNSIIYGTYNSSISYAQSRVQIAWNKIIRPDGYVINLGNFNAVDKRGAAGIKGFVNDHPLAWLKAIAVMSVFNIVNKEFEASLGSTKNEYIQDVLANSQQIANQLGEKLIDRAMDVQPTITKPAGTIVYVLTNTPLTLPPVDMPPVTQPYLKKFSWQN